MAWIKPSSGGGSQPTSAIRAYRSTNLSVAAATFTKVIFDTEVYDNDAEYDPTTGRFTALSAGTYLVDGRVAWQGAVDGNRTILAIYVNGLRNTRLSDITVSGTSPTQNTGSIILKLNANDYVELYAYTTNAEYVSGSSETTTLGIIQLR